MTLPNHRLYVVKYGDIVMDDGDRTDRRYVEGDVVSLTADDADFLGDQVALAPESLTGPDTQAINDSVGHELAIFNDIPVREIENSYGPSDDVNDINVEQIEDDYEKRKNT